METKQAILPLSAPVSTSILLCLGNRHNHITVCDETIFVSSMTLYQHAMLVFIHPCNLVGKCPKPLNDFREIGCAPAELNINLSSESESGIFRLTAFMHIRFFLISVDRHLAKVSAHILYPKLRHPRLYQAEFFFIYEKFDLYRSLAIPVVWHRDSSLLLRIISNQNRSIIDVQFCVLLQNHA